MNDHGSLFKVLVSIGAKSPRKKEGIPWQFVQVFHTKVSLLRKTHLIAMMAKFDDVKLKELQAAE